MNPSVDTPCVINPILATVPVTVEYSLTATGLTLSEPLDAVRRWAEQHIQAVLSARSRHRPRTPVAR